MCVTAVVKCWHRGEWFAKQANRGEFENCPFCGKGFEQLGAEAQRAKGETSHRVRRTFRIQIRPLFRGAHSDFSLENCYASSRPVV